MSQPLADRLRSPEPLLPLPELARKVFITWEKLRLLYVVIVGLWSLLLVSMLSPGGQWQAVPTLLVGGLVANVLYFAGPAIDTYARWLGLSPTVAGIIRWAMFVGGTLLTMGLAFDALLPAWP